MTKLLDLRLFVPGSRLSSSARNGWTRPKILDKNATAVQYFHDFQLKVGSWYYMKSHLGIRNPFLSEIRLNITMIQFNYNRLLKLRIYLIALRLPSCFTSVSFEQTNSLLTQSVQAIYHWGWHLNQPNTVVQNNPERTNKSMETYTYTSIMQKIPTQIGDVTILSSNQSETRGLVSSEPGGDQAS